MRRKFKLIDLSKLMDADDTDRTSKKGVMRKLYPAINRKLIQGGWSAKDMVAWLSKHGMEISVGLFRVYLRDIDREHGFERSANKPLRNPEVGARPHVAVAIPKAPSANEQISSTDTNSALQAELVRPAGMSDAAWSEMKARDRAAKRKLKLNNGA